jgi:hypothetical protein
LRGTRYTEKVYVNSSNHVKAPAARDTPLGRGGEILDDASVFGTAPSIFCSDGWTMHRRVERNYGRSF